MTVEVFSKEDSGWFIDRYTSGSTDKITLKRKNAHGGYDYASCEDILNWDEEYMSNDLFDEWVECAKAGEEGYWALIYDGVQAVAYGNH